MMIFGVGIKHRHQIVNQPLWCARAQNWIALQIDAVIQRRPIHPIVIDNFQIVVAQVQATQFRYSFEWIFYCLQPWIMWYYQLDAIGFGFYGNVLKINLKNLWNSDQCEWKIGVEMNGCGTWVVGWEKREENWDQKLYKPIELNTLASNSVSMGSSLKSKIWAVSVVMNSMVLIGFPLSLNSFKTGACAPRYCGMLANALYDPSNTSNTG